MEAKELRITNYVGLANGVQESEQTLFKIKSLFYNEPQNQYTAELNSGHLVNLDVLRPINITGEILIKLGFEVIVGRINETFKIDYGAYFLQITLQNDGLSWNLRMSNHDFNEDADVVGLGIFKHVHHLQNLLFSLTQIVLSAN